MAQSVQFSAAPGRALTAQLVNEADLTLAETASAVVESTIGIFTETGAYTATFTDASGTYRLVVIDDIAQVCVAQWRVTLTGTASATVQAYEYTGSSSGVATETKQDQIIAAITPITTVYSPQPSSEVISLIHGDAYDGQANNKLSWTASKDVDGETVNFTIRDSMDVIVLDQDTTGVTATATGTLVEVSLSTAATELLNPAATIYKFDVEIEFTSDSRWTITRGTVCVEGDESR